VFGFFFLPLSAHPSVKSSGICFRFGRKAKGKARLAGLMEAALSQRRFLYPLAVRAKGGTSVPYPVWMSKRQR
jgi:hypothetical protein